MSDPFQKSISEPAPSQINDGGPAFPPHFEPAHCGMSLRDWFAGMALQAMAAHWANGLNPHEQSAADMAYRYADAMLAESSKAQ